MQKVEELNEHTANLMEKQTNFFWKIQPHRFKAKMKKAYWGIPPFTKDDSYSEFERQDASNFAEIHYVMRFLHQWVRHDTDLQGVKPSKQDRVTALQLLRELREEAERVKCDCCNGTGFKKKV